MVAPHARMGYRGIPQAMSPQSGATHGHTDHHQGLEEHIIGYKSHTLNMLRFFYPCAAPPGLNGSKILP